MTSLRRRLVPVLAVGLCAAAASGCAQSGASTGPTTSSAPTSTLVRYHRQYVTVAGKPILVPTERGNIPIQPSQDDGLQIIIVPSGFEPHLLFAVDDKPVTFTNLTGVGQRLRFLNAPGHSPVIAPGGTWSYHPTHAQNFVYVNRLGQRGEFFASPDVPSEP